MRRPRLAGWVALALLCGSSATDELAAAEKKRANTIKVVEATYGGNCDGVTKGNVTSFLASACANTDLCNYRVYYKSMGGDPAPACEKDFKVTYTCGRSSKSESCTLAAEAGKGGEDGQPNQFLPAALPRRNEISYQVAAAPHDTPQETRTPAFFELRHGWPPRQ
jgi:hypothetical protein